MLATIWNLRSSLFLYVLYRRWLKNNECPIIKRRILPENAARQRNMFKALSSFSCACRLEVRHFGAKAGRVLSSWSRIHKRVAGAGQPSLPLVPLVIGQREKRGWLETFITTPCVRRLWAAVQVWSAVWPQEQTPAGPALSGQWRHKTHTSSLCHKRWPGN